MSRTDHNDTAIETLEDADLSSVTGGRVSRMGADPRVVEGIKQLAEAIALASQNMAQAKAANGQQTAQMMMQMMQSKRG